MALALLFADHCLPAAAEITTNLRTSASVAAAAAATTANFGVFLLDRFAFCLSQEPETTAISAAF